MSSIEIGVGSPLSPVVRLLLRGFRKVVVYLLLAAVALSALFPVAWMLYSSFKPTADIYSSVFALPTGIYLGNYRDVADEVGRWVVNSLVVDCISVGVILVISSLAAYAFSHLSFWGKEPLYVFMLVGLMIPPQALVIAGYKWISVLQLDGIPALILTYASWSTFGILVMRGAFDAVPKQLIESARLDGANDWQILIRILLPITRGSLATVTIFMFIWFWNDFVFPLVYLQDPDEVTVPVGILAFQSRTGVQWGPQMAALAMATVVPLVVYLVARKQFVRGVMEGALKG